MTTKPGWVCRVLAGKHWSFGNLRGYEKGLKTIWKIGKTLPEELLYFKTDSL